MCLLAPEIEQRYNRLPTDFPPRVLARGAPSFDLRDARLSRIRERTHGRVRVIDADAAFRDEEPGYHDDHRERPFLVEACFRSGGHPLRLQVTVINERHGEVSFALHGLVRPSTPPLRIHASWIHSLMALLRLKRDATSGDDEIDRRLVIDALPVDAKRAFSPELRRGISEMVEGAARPQLTVAAGQARLEWEEKRGDGHSLPPAVRTMVALRELSPVALVPRRQ